MSLETPMEKNAKVSQNVQSKNMTNNASQQCDSRMLYYI